MFSKKIVLASAICILSAACSHQPKPSDSAATPAAQSPRVPSANDEKISLNDLMTNSSATHEKVAGLRDYRVVIPGVLYRGGNSGGGQLPLKDVGLKALSDRGFSSSVYMYPNGYNASVNTYGVKYSTFGGGLKDRRLVHGFLAKVKDIIENKKGPMYVHCWNGWHASGEMASYALMQFCGMNGEQAYSYWKANVPNGNVTRMKTFQTFDDLKISAADAARICPR